MTLCVTLWLRLPYIHIFTCLSIHAVMGFWCVTAWSLLKLYVWVSVDSEQRDAEMNDTKLFSQVLSIFMFVVSGRIASYEVSVVFTRVQM